MITRGYFIGEIVDTLGDVARQVETRTKLNLNDLPVFVESFFLGVLNHIFDLRLENLNASQSNFPGLDLGDKAAKCAFQVTAQRSSAKVNETLKKLTADMLTTYSHIRILIVGGKQGRYAIEPTEAARVGFKEEHIFDINDLCKRTMDLSIDRLQSLFDFIRRETTRVRVELEIPDEQGVYPTSVYNFVESRPIPKLTECYSFSNFQQTIACGFLQQKVQEELSEFAHQLAMLPRTTREFFAILIDERDRKHRRFRTNGFRVNEDRIRRVIRYPDSEGELRLLKAEGFATWDEPDHQGASAYYTLLFPGLSSEHEILVDEYVVANGLSWRKVVVELDLRDF